MKYFTLFFLIVFTSCNKETDKDSKKVNFNIKLNSSVNNYDLILDKPILDYPALFLPYVYALINPKKFKEIKKYQSIVQII